MVLALYLIRTGGVGLAPSDDGRRGASLLPSETEEEDRALRPPGAKEKAWAWPPI